MQTKRRSCLVTDTTLKERARASIHFFMKKVGDGKAKGMRRLVVRVKCLGANDVRCGTVHAVHEPLSMSDVVIVLGDDWGGIGAGGSHQ